MKSRWRWDGRWWVIRYEAPLALPYTSGGESRERASQRWGESVVSSSGLNGEEWTMIRGVRGFLCGWEGGGEYLEKFLMYHSQSVSPSSVS